MKIKIILADDHTVVRQGLKALINATSEFEVVGEAGTGRAAVAMARKLAPEVAVMDFAMPELNGLDATRQIKMETPEVKVLILSCYRNEEYVRRVVEAGASGFLFKQTACNELLTAIREVRRGNMFFSSGLASRISDLRRDHQAGRREDTSPSRLTPRESEVLQLVAEGRATKQIADDLSISAKTVEKHRQQVMNKLNIHQIAGLTRYAVDRGIIQVGTAPA